MYVPVLSALPKSHFEHLQYADAAAAWELTHKAQMKEAGLEVETVGEGIAVLLQAFKLLNAWNKLLHAKEN